MTTTPATQALLPCPFCKRTLSVVPSLARAFDPPRPLVEYVHAKSDCLIGRRMWAFYDDEPEKFAEFAAQWNARTDQSLPGDVGIPAWRTIDSAPTDGQTILAICASAYTPTAFDTWWQDGWTHYSRPDEKWHGGVGKWFPTHWMPREIYLAALTPSALSGDAGEAMSKRTFLTCVSGDGPQPYLKVHFNNLADAHAAHDELLGRKGKS